MRNTTHSITINTPASSASVGFSDEEIDARLGIRQVWDYLIGPALIAMGYSLQQINRLFEELCIDEDLSILDLPTDMPEVVEDDLQGNTPQPGFSHWGPQ